MNVMYECYVMNVLLYKTSEDVEITIWWNVYVHACNILLYINNSKIFMYLGHIICPLCFVFIWKSVHKRQSDNILLAKMDKRSVTGQRGQLDRLGEMKAI